MTQDLQPEPFYETPPGSASRRLLLLTYHFPPASTAGSLRWQKLADHAARRGLGLDVITLAPEAVSGVDVGRLEELPEGTRVFGVQATSLILDRVEAARDEGAVREAATLGWSDRRRCVADHRLCRIGAEHR
jgi:hypothetical protein